MSRYRVWLHNESWWDDWWNAVAILCGAFVGGLIVSQFTTNVLLFGIGAGLCVGICCFISVNRHVLWTDLKHLLRK